MLCLKPESESEVFFPSFRQLPHLHTSSHCFSSRRCPMLRVCGSRVCCHATWKNRCWTKWSGLDWLKNEHDDKLQESSMSLPFVCIHRATKLFRRMLYSTVFHCASFVAFSMFSGLRCFPVFPRTSAGYVATFDTVVPPSGVTCGQSRVT